MADDQLTVRYGGQPDNGAEEIKARPAGENWTSLLTSDGWRSSARQFIEREKTCPAPDSLTRDRIYLYSGPSLPSLLQAGKPRFAMLLPDQEEINAMLSVGGGGIRNVAKGVTGTRAGAGVAEALPAGKTASYSKPPVGEFPKARYTFDAPTGQYRDLTTGQFVAPKNFPRPDSFGFASSEMQIVPPGKILDRVGKEYGRFMGEPGTSISARGLPMGSEGLPYSQYRVLKPIEMQVGPAAPVPVYGASGGAPQYLPRLSVKQLLEQGYLEKIK
jgi:hypothetical protein